MSVREIRDPVEARRFVAQGLWFQRVFEPRAHRVEEILAWSMEAAAGGEPIAPVGLVADLGHLIFEPEGLGFSDRSGVVVPGWPPGRVRAYDDLVLGKLDTDPTIGRASEALARSRGRDRARGLAFVLARLLDRSRCEGVLINPVALKLGPGRLAADFLNDGWESLERDGPMPELLDLYDRLVEAAREMGDALGPEDVFELEHGTALAAFGQRLALRQVLQSAAEFEAATAKDRPRPTGRSLGVSTRFLHEDAYPVGGFSSISTRGSIESLLHSQLVYMEAEERPDLFDIKYVRDELLYYARDENQFLRRRRTFVFALAPDLELARVKDAGLPRQRLVLLLGALVAAVRRLVEWLGDEALTFEFLFLEVGGAGPLDRDRELVELVLSESIALGEVVVSRLPIDTLAEHCELAGRRSLCQVLVASCHPGPAEVGPTPASRWVLDASIPGLGLDGGDVVRTEADNPLDAWRDQLNALLGHWV
jgi:hypothetical protein